MMKFETWTVAYRDRKQKILLEDSKRPFQIISNTWRYWCADPHLCEYQGRHFVFAELYDKIYQKGVIGYCEILKDRVTEWKVVLQEKYHLSYPHIFSYQSCIYMIPESYKNKEIALYKAVKFPDKWEKVDALKSDYVAVDSGIFCYGEKYWLQTLQVENGCKIFRIFPFEDGKLLDESLCAFDDDPNKRPAGQVYQYKGKWIRPAQDCSKEYGCALNFYEIVDIGKNSYEEALIAKIYPEEIHSDIKGIPAGIHTYNQNEFYEVIDIKTQESDWLRNIVYLFKGFANRVKRLVNRYEGKTASK